MSRYTQSQNTAIMSEYVNFYKTDQRLMGILAPRVRNQAGQQWSQDFEASVDINLKSYGVYEQHISAESGDPVRATWTMGAVYMDDQISGLQQEYQGAPGSLATGTIRKIGPEAHEKLRDKFKQAFKTRLWNAAGAALNGGGGVEPVGITQFVVQSPSTGTYAGISRVTYSNWRNYQISGAAGPSTSWVQDAWERVLTAQMGARDPSGAHGKGSVLLGTVANVIQIQNKAYSQNTNVGSEVNKIKSVNGLELVSDDDVGAGLVYILDPRYIGVAIPMGRSAKNFGMKFYSKSKLPEQVHPDDEVMVIDFVGTPYCDFPAAQSIITSAS